ncbi:MAG: cphA [Gemmatimonadetes bacterium]|nr:cphA [Gemmatimonadota bacterium]
MGEETGANRSGGLSTAEGGVAIAAAPFGSAEMLVSRVRALRGPNYWRLAPVIACDVRLGALERATSAELPDFCDRLLAFLPSLREHLCVGGASGDFAEALTSGAELTFVLERVALELQKLVGCDVSFGRVVHSGDTGVWWVIVAYDEEDVGLDAMHDAVLIVRACIDGAPLEVGALVADLQDTYERSRLGPSTAAIVEEARRRGIPVRRLNSRSLVQLGLGRNLRRIQATISENTGSIAVEIAQNKEDTKRVLSNIGLPVPLGGAVRSLEHAIELANEIGYPVILKPIDSSHGRGISGRLDSPDALPDAWELARVVSLGVLVEHFHTGRDHRVLVVNGRTVACAERVPAHVVGDGERTIRELIDAANRDPRRGAGHRKILTHLPNDERTVAFLAKHALSLDSVPLVGERVSLRGTANLSTGGTSIDRTDEMHPDNVTACEMAAAIVGLDIAGIDVLTADISVPFRDNGAVLLEVNAAPGIRMHTHPTEGRSRNAAGPIVDMLYPPGTDATVPILAVTGTNGKTTTVRLLAHLFRNTGHHVGFTTTDGVYIHDRLVMEGDMTGPFAANIILSNPTIDVAVLETARGGILRSGLGFDECDVGIVLNVAADHLGLRGINTVEQLADAKSVIPAVVKREGHAVLNADDALVYAMREKTGGDVVLFTACSWAENPRVVEHLARGGIAVCIDDGQFTVRRGTLRIPIATEREVPLMLGGAARFQRQNVLAAIAAAYARGMRYDDVRAGLLSFFPSAVQSPGRLNIIPLRNGARAIVDYAHNPPAIAGLVDLIRRMPARRRVGIVTVPGDRRDDDIREAGRLCAGFDHVIIKEDRDLRGREPGGIAALLREGLAQSGRNGGSVETIPSAQVAIERGMALVGQDDLLIILAEKVPQTLAAIRAYAVNRE